MKRGLVHRRQRPDIVRSLRLLLEHAQSRTQSREANLNFPHTKQIEILLRTVRFTCRGADADLVAEYRRQATTVIVLGPTALRCSNQQPVMHRVVLRAFGIDSDRSTCKWCF